MEPFSNDLFSMTGFGRAEILQDENLALVEIKSLNGKQFDLNLKIPPVLKPYEAEIRNLLNQQLLRGSVDCAISIKMNGTTRPVVVNTDLIKYYFSNIKQVADELQLDTAMLLDAILKMPDVVAPSSDALNEEQWALVHQAIKAALADLNTHRQSEGKALQVDIEKRIRNISQYAQEVEALAPQRQVRLKEGFEKKLEEWVGKENIDANRLEQELIYYIEKFDISEELVRLKNHCQYFFELLSANEHSKGKKLGFLLQEIGREINTTGSKAYDADIQKWVVNMKDELEKAKEQVLNIL